MANEAPLPLGAQMAVVYVGINVFFSMALSAVLSVLVIIIVQINKVFRQKTGKLTLSNTVTPLGSASHHKCKDEGQSTGKSEQEEIVTKGEKRVKWADVRKRRPSNPGFVDLTAVKNKNNVSLSPVEPSPQTPVDLDHPDGHKPTSISAFSFDNNAGVVRNRQGRAKSKTRVNPDITQAPMPSSPDKDPNEWAMVSPWNMGKGSVSSPDSEKPPRRDEVVTPSACNIDVPIVTEQTRPDKKASVFVSDMDAYDIW